MHRNEWKTDCDINMPISINENKSEIFRIDNLTK